MVERIKLAVDELFSPWLITSWSKQASIAALAMAGLLCFLSFTQTIYDWYEDLTLTNDVAHLSSQKKNNDDQLIAALPEEHLFGSQNAPQEFVPITSLHLRLVGILKSVPEKFSKIIISEADQPGKVYQIGDSLPSGVRVNSITNDGVILENSGHLEKLPLPRSPLAFSGLPKPLSRVD